MSMQKLNRAIMYRAYPTPEQQVLLSKTFGCVRFVWNHMLMDAQRFLEEAGAYFIRLRRKTPSFSYGDIRHSETYTVMFTICASIK